MNRKREISLASAIVPTLPALLCFNTFCKINLKFSPGFHPYLAKLITHGSSTFKELKDYWISQKCFLDLQAIGTAYPLCSAGVLVHSEVNRRAEYSSLPQIKERGGKGSRTGECSKQKAFWGSYTLLGQKTSKFSLTSSSSPLLYINLGIVS